MVVHAEGIDRRPAKLSRGHADESNPAPARTARSCGSDPHLLVEGCLLASIRDGAHACYIYVRGEFIRERRASAGRGRTRAYEAKLVGKNTSRLAVRHLRDPRRGAYICRRRDGAA